MWNPFRRERKGLVINRQLASELLLPRTERNWRAEFANPTLSTLVAASVNWLARAAAEARPVVRKWNEQSRTFDVLDNHPLVQQLQRPNFAYGYSALVMATVRDLVVHGNAFWLKRRTRSGRVESLWYVAAPYVRAALENRLPTYAINGMQVDTRDVVHFRYLLGDDGFLGVSPLESLWRELATDEEASNFLASVLRNVGIPGVIISPKGDIELTKDDAEALVEMWRQKLSGDRRGEPVFVSGAVEIERLSWSPAELDLRNARRTAEERVAAVLGIPAIVLGFGAGLERSTFSNYSEARDAAYEQVVLPLLRLMADELTLQLLPDFDTSGEVWFAVNELRALQEDAQKLADRAVKLFEAGIITTAEAREMLGFEAEPRESSTAGMALETKARRNSPVKFLRELNRHVRRDTRLLERELRKYFTDLGDRVVEALREELERETLSANVERKQFTEERVRELLRGIMLAAPSELAAVLEMAYGRALGNVAATVEAVLGLAVNIPDELARDILRQGRGRVQLMNLPTEILQNVNRVLAEGREQGLNPLEIARQLRTVVPAGKWKSPEIRARVIARTETLHAYRVSALTTYKTITKQVMVFDNQIDFNDPECSERDGRIVPFEEAERMMRDEHPNGTLNFAPVVE
jgi:HK97 family phage portal protein